METSSLSLRQITTYGSLPGSSPRRNCFGIALSLLLLASFAKVNAATVQVLVGNAGNNFSPASVSIQAGDTVEWSWVGSGHSTTSGVPGAPNGVWDSGVHVSGFTFSHTFPAAGSFSYFCTPHGACCGMVGTVNVGAATATPTPIPKGPIYVQPTTVASGLTAPGGLVSPADGSGRLFIVQQTGQILILKSGTVSATPFLDVSSRLVALSPSYDERGLLGFAFHPDFNNSSAPGFHKVYTYTSEPVSGAADFTVPNPSAFDHQSVIAEWKVSAGNANAIDPATRREVMRIDEPQSNHNGGDLAFRAADHYLYISLGDGGAANDVGAGHNPTTGNGQDKSTVLGKILRIDPLNPALTPGSADPPSANGKYRVPQSNPFVGQAGAVAEIYIFGLRNPYRFSFDATSNKMLIGDVGQNNIEEVDVGASGKNYGWNKKEGSFLFDPATGSVAPDPAPDPALTDPLAEYSHTDGSAVIGGFVYRGALLSALSGKYVFGDLASGSNGRFFYADLTSGVIQELRLGALDTPLGLFLKGFGRDATGELYALADSNIGPSGTGGKVLKLTTIPPANAVSRKMHGVQTFDISLLAANSTECRSSGASNDYQIVLTFPTAVTFGSAAVTPGPGATGSITGSPTTSPDGKMVTVNLTNVSNTQTLTLSLLGVNDGTTTHDVSVQMAVLVGDTSGNGVVNASDVSLTKLKSGQAVDASNFREDVIVSGVINSSDVSAVKLKSGTALP
jgi:plastocyanin